ncbi:uncharacterized protein LOC126792640 [Argentina anserina]|uniref:uncharacterized protein LOC126792640 n=1 Tax=Argentina anserina TaxID=57926 RepID=UPI0021762D61|nr:uncharacterized protein LOC126792640 [Potentilla anserina]XP_050375041.1 uncharacterized protein LOC126792640 [Potentilla anserina]
MELYNNAKESLACIPNPKQKKVEAEKNVTETTSDCILNPKQKIVEVEKNAKETTVACKQNPKQGKRHKIYVFGLEHTVVVRDMKDIQEKLKKSTYERVTFICKRVKETLGSPEKYTEFLKQFHMYASGVIDATEFLNLIDDLVQADQSLMHDFDEFLEHYDKVDALVSLNFGLEVGL